MNAQQMDRQQAAEYAETSYQWGARTVPSEFEPVQLDTSIVASCIDWWNVRSKLFCCFFPCMKCIAGNKTYNADDVEIWKKQLELNRNPECPDSMRGVWWLKYNHAHEQLVTIFSDAEFNGTFNKEGTDGLGTWKRPLANSWSRDNTCFGLVLAAAGKITGNEVEGFMNMRDGICTVKSGVSDQVIYRISDDEWWKIHYEGKPGTPKADEINFMYKWIKVIDKDGNKTEHWDEYVDWANKPLPHRNCGASWFPCWPCCLSDREKTENMILSNDKQVIRFDY